MEGGSSLGRMKCSGTQTTPLLILESPAESMLLLRNEILVSSAANQECSATKVVTWHLIPRGCRSDQIKQHISGLIHIWLSTLIFLPLLCNIKTVSSQFIALNKLHCRIITPLLLCKTLFKCHARCMTKTIKRKTCTPHTCAQFPRSPTFHSHAAQSWEKQHAVDLQNPKPSGVEELSRGRETKRADLQVFRRVAAAPPMLTCG